MSCSFLWAQPLHLGNSLCRQLLKGAFLIVIFWTIPLQALTWPSCATCLFQGWAGNTQRHHCTNKRKRADIHTYTHILADKRKNTLTQCHPKIRGCMHKHMCMYLYSLYFLSLLTSVFETCTKRCDQDT